MPRKFEGRCVCSIRSASPSCPWTTISASCKASLIWATWWITVKDYTNLKHNMEIIHESNNKLLNNIIILGHTKPHIHECNVFQNLCFLVLKEAKGTHYMSKKSSQHINKVISLLMHVIDTIWLKSGMGKGLEHRGNITCIAVKVRKVKFWHSMCALTTGTRIGQSCG